MGFSLGKEIKDFLFILLKIKNPRHLKGKAHRHYQSQICKFQHRLKLTNKKY